MALGHRGVQARHHHREVGDLEQGPRLVRPERHSRHVRVELVERGHELLPLREVRWHRRALVGVLGRKVALARLPVDVVVAGHHCHPGARQPHRLGQLGDEPERLLDLRAEAPLGEVAGDHHQVRMQVVRVGQPGQVGVEAGVERVVCLVGRGQPVAAEEVVPAELRVGQVQDRDPVRGRMPRPWLVEDRRPGQVTSSAAPTRVPTPAVAPSGPTIRTTNRSGEASAVAMPVKCRGPAGRAQERPRTGLGGRRRDRAQERRRTRSRPRIQSASIPSRQVIFLPSWRVRAR